MDADPAAADLVSVAPADPAEIKRTWVDRSAGYSEVEPFNDPTLPLSRRA